MGALELLEAMPPFLGGGEMIRDVRLDGFTTNELPWKFEAGTPAIVEAVGFGAAVDYISALGMDAVRDHERQLTRYALDALARPLRRRLTIYGPTDVDVRGGAVSFLFDGIHAHDVSQVLDEDAVCVRAGHHCAKPLMRQLGVPATTRASFYVYNDEADVDALVEALAKAQKFFAVVGSQQMAGLEDLYREIILDHYRSPRNRGELPVPPAHKVEGFNPLCGDEVVLYLDVDRRTRSRDLKIAGQGCSISQASTSMMSAAVKGKPSPRPAGSSARSRR